MKGNLGKVMKGGKAMFVQALETTIEKYVMAREFDLSRVKDLEKLSSCSVPFCIVISCTAMVTTDKELRVES